jgi:hypothetical protein
MIATTPPSLEHSSRQDEAAVLDPIREQLAHSRRPLALAARPREPGLDLDGLVEHAHVLHLEARAREKRLPFSLRAAANVRRVAQPLGLLDGVAHMEVVGDQDERRADARHLRDPALDILEVVRGHPARHDVEDAVFERELLGARDDVRLHAGGRVRANHLKAGLAEPTRDVAAARRDVEGAPPGRLGRPLDDQVEVFARAVRLAVAIERGALAPDLAHAASSTARRAASSIVGSV